jgi:hypothetical protein
MDTASKEELIFRFRLSEVLRIMARDEKQVRRGLTAIRPRMDA